MQSGLLLVVTANGSGPRDAGVEDETRRSITSDNDLKTGAWLKAEQPEAGDAGAGD